MGKEEVSEVEAEPRSRRRYGFAAIASLGGIAATLLVSGAFSHSHAPRHSSRAKTLTYLQKAKLIEAQLNNDKTHRVATGITLDDSMVLLSNGNNFPAVSVSNGYDFRNTPIELDTSHDATLRIKDGVVKLNLFTPKHREMISSGTDTGSLEVVEASPSGGYSIAFVPSGEPIYNKVIGAPEPAVDASCVALKMMGVINSEMAFPVDGYSDAKDHIHCNTNSSSATISVTN